MELIVHVSDFLHAQGESVLAPVVNLAHILRAELALAQVALEIFLSRVQAHDVSFHVGLIVA